MVAELLPAFSMCVGIFEGMPDLIYEQKQFSTGIDLSQVFSPGKTARFDAAVRRLKSPVRPTKLSNL
jgi:hypothetical protein